MTDSAGAGLSLSTSWSPYRGAILAAVIAQGRSLGFASFELGVSSMQFAWSELEQATREVRFSSVHNHLFRSRSRKLDPRGDGISSQDERIRKEAVRRTILTMEAAATLGARGVVVHGGAIDWKHATRIQADLMHRYEREGGSGELLDDAASLWDQRIARARPYVDATVRSLREITAAGLGVAIGLETRFGFHEIPDPWELERIFQDVSSTDLYYWHDVGHAQVQEHLGWSHHEDWLDRFGDRLLGMHIHDVAGCRDHLPPGRGSVDYARLRPYLRPDTLRVLEVSPFHSAAEIAEGKARLEALGIV